MFKEILVWIFLVKNQKEVKKSHLMISELVLKQIKSLIKFRRLKVLHLSCY